MKTLKTDQSYDPEILKNIATMSTYASNRNECKQEDSEHIHRWHEPYFVRGCHFAELLISVLLRLKFIVGFPGQLLLSNCRGDIHRNIYFRTLFPHIISASWITNERRRWFFMWMYECAQILRCFRFLSLIYFFLLIILSADRFDWQYSNIKCRYYWLPQLDDVLYFPVSEVIQFHCKKYL